MTINWNCNFLWIPVTALNNPSTELTMPKYEVHTGTLLHWLPCPVITMLALIGEISIRLLNIISYHARRLNLLASCVPKWKQCRAIMLPISSIMDLPGSKWGCQKGPFWNRKSNHTFSSIIFGCNVMDCLSAECSCLLVIEHNFDLNGPWYAYCNTVIR